MKFFLLFLIMASVISVRDDKLLSKYPAAVLCLTQGVQDQMNVCCSGTQPTTKATKVQEMFVENMSRDKVDGIVSYLSIVGQGRVRACCHGIPEIDKDIKKNHFEKEARINCMIREIITHHNEFAYYDRLGSYNALFRVFYQASCDILYTVIFAKYFSFPHTLLFTYTGPNLGYKNPSFLSLSQLRKYSVNIAESERQVLNNLIIDLKEFKQKALFMRSGVFRMSIDVKNMSEILACLYI